MLRLFWLLVAACAAFTLGAACSGPKAAPATCNLTYDCGAGQTCWASDGNAFACVNAGPTALGASCDPSLQAGVVCGEGLLCLGLGNPPVGTCTGWCGPTRACPSDQACVVLATTFDAPIRACSVSDPTSCAFAYDCAADQTCWTSDGTVFACQAAGTLALGAACDLAQVNAECAAGLVCFGSGDSAAGSCAAWCAADATCPSGQSCHTFGTTYGVTVRICQ